MCVAITITMDQQLRQAFKVFEHKMQNHFFKKYIGYFKSPLEKSDLQSKKFNFPL